MVDPRHRYPGDCQTIWKLVLLMQVVPTIMTILPHHAPCRADCPIDSDGHRVHEGKSDRVETVGDG